MDNMSLQTVERALKVLEIIAGGSMSNQEIEKAMGLNRTTIARLIYTLLNNGYIEKDESSNNYKLGLKVVELSSIRLNQVELKTEAVPYLRELSLKLNQVCHMGTLVDGEVVYIEKIEPISTMRMFSAIGKRVPVHSTSLGKSLISEFEDAEILKILKQKGMEKYTDNTKTDMAVILQEIQSVRKNGYAVDDAENEENIWCVSAPIKDYRNKVIAAVSTSGQNSAYVSDPNSIAVKLIKETAHKISKRMGCNN